MNSKIKIFSILFVVQLVLVVFLWNQPDKFSAPEGEAFITLDAEALDKIVVKEGDKKVVLEKSGEGWVIPDYQGVAAESSKVEELVKRLQDLKSSWAIANSDSTAVRFEVTDSNAQKIVELYEKGDLKNTVYLGTSPGYRKVHARLNEDSEIYSVELSQHMIPSTNEDWFDRSLIAFADDLQAIKVGETINLKKAGDDWSVVPSKENHRPDQEAITKFAGHFKDLSVNSLLAPDEAEKVTILDPITTAEVKGASETRRYVFYKKDDAYYISPSDDDRVFEISNFKAEQITDATLETLYPENQTEPENAEGAPDVQVMPDIGGGNAPAPNIN